MFPNSKKSEFDPREGVSIFQMILKFKKSELSGSGQIGNFSHFLLYFNNDDDGSPKAMGHLF